MPGFNTKYVNGTTNAQGESTQNIGIISPSQVGILSGSPVDRSSVGEGWVVGLQIQGISKAVHFASLANANAFIQNLNTLLS